MNILVRAQKLLEENEKENEKSRAVAFLQMLCRF